MRECLQCQMRGQTWSGDKPKCAFVSGVFKDDNWNCATMNMLRDIAESDGFCDRHNDCSIGVVRTEDVGHIVMTWYKNRGCTGNAFYVCDDEREDLTLEMAEEAIEFFCKTRKRVE